jgi:hypothetical protein
MARSGTYRYVPKKADDFVSGIMNKDNCKRNVAFIKVAELAERGHLVESDVFKYLQVYGKKRLR